MICNGVVRQNDTRHNWVALRSQHCSLVPFKLPMFHKYLFSFSYRYYKVKIVQQRSRSNWSPVPDVNQNIPDSSLLKAPSTGPRQTRLWSAPSVFELLLHPLLACWSRAVGPAGSCRLGGLLILCGRAASAFTAEPCHARCLPAPNTPLWSTLRPIPTVAGAPCPVYRSPRCPGATSSCLGGLPGYTTCDQILIISA